MESAHTEPDLEDAYPYPVINLSYGVEVINRGRGEFYIQNIEKPPYACRILLYLSP
jgi:hypothetical protein